jgi:glutamate dehydrogenase (NADP+)
MIEELDNSSLEGKLCAVSGSGNVAQFAAEKLLEFGGIVVSLSDSRGCITVEDGTGNILTKSKEIKLENQVK